MDEIERCSASTINSSSPAIRNIYLGIVILALSILLALRWYLIRSRQSRSPSQAFVTQPLPIASSNQPDDSIKLPDFVREHVHVQDSPAIVQEHLTSVGEGVINFAATAELSWQRATALYEGWKSTGIDTASFDAMSSLAGTMVQEAFPALVEVAKTIPLVGAVTAAAIMYYKTYRKMSETCEAVDELNNLIKDTVLLFKNMDPRLRHQIASDVNMIIIQKHMIDVVHAIDEATTILTTIETRCSGSKVVYLKQDCEKVLKLVSSIYHARGAMTDHLVVLRCSDDQLERAYPRAYIYFEADINRHLQRFVIGSRGWMTQCVDDWLANPHGERFFWIKADAGMGKSAFAASIIRKLQASDQLIASFFCKYGQKDRSDVESIFISLAYQIALRYPESYHAVINASSRLKKQTALSLEEKFDAMIAEPLNQADWTSRSNMVLVIDALDEIDGIGSNKKIDFLRVLVGKIPDLPKQIKVLLTSRPDADINHIFTRFQPALIEADDPRHISDLEIYTRAQLQGHLDRPDDEDAAVALLLQKSQHRFIFMALVAKDKFHGDVKYSFDQLSSDFPDGLDGVYVVNFRRICTGKLRFMQERIMPLIHLLVVMMEPLTVHDAQALLRCSDDDMNDLINRLGYMFPVVGEGDYRSFTVYHKTVLDWLSDATKSRKKVVGRMLSLYGIQQIYPDVDSVDLEQDVLTLLQHDYRQYDDIIAFDDEDWRKLSLKPRYRKTIKDFFQGKTAADFNDALEFDFHVDERLAHALFSQGLLSQIQGYDNSSLFISSTFIFPSKGWKYLYDHLIEHMVRCGRGDEAKILLLHLSWLEISIRLRPTGALDVWKDMRYVMQEAGPSARSLDECLKLVSHAIQMSQSILSGIVDREEQWWTFVLNLIGHLRATTADRRNIILTKLVENCLQLFEQRQSVYPIKYELEPAGEALQATLVHAAADVYSVCISSDDTTIIAGYSDSTIKVWDAISGACKLTLQGHSKSVASVSITPDDKKIISGGSDDTIKIWDAVSGECEMTLLGHSNTVNTVCLSPDGQKIISGSKDKSIMVWDAQTGECLMILEEHIADVCSVCMSPNGGLIISGSYDNKIKIWDAETGACILTLTGHWYLVVSVCISSDGKRIISGSCDKTIKVWDLDFAETGTCSMTIKTQAEIRSVCISPDDKKIIAGSSDATIKIWDIATGTCEKIFTGHVRVISFGISCLCISSDGSKIISGGYDKTIKIWDAITGTCDTTTQRHRDMVISICISSDGSRTVTGSGDNIVKIWDAATGACEMTFNEHSNFIRSVGISPDGRKVISGGADRAIKIWDAATGVCETTIQNLFDEDEGATQICISTDATKVAIGTMSSISMWDITTETAVREMTCSSHFIVTLCISSDNKWIISGSQDKSVKVWDAATGSCEMTLAGHQDDSIFSINLTSDRRKIISSSYSNFNSTFHVWDLETKTVIKSYHQVKFRWLFVVGDGIEEALVDETMKILQLLHVGDLCSVHVSKHFLCLGTWSGRVYLFGLRKQFHD